MKTFGSGNAPQKKWLIDALSDAIRRGIIIVNVSQCATGKIEMKRYETGLQLINAGVISGYDCTIESILTKLMFLFGMGYSNEKVKKELERPIAGEFSLN